jgi:DNA-binding NarL/FixJ family response regulator
MHSKPSSTDGAGAKTIQICITDDSKVYTLRLKALVERAATDCGKIVCIITADNPTSAVELIKQHDFDIVFVDDVFCNSNLNGRDILQIVRSSQQNNNQHILVSGKKLIRKLNPLHSDVTRVSEISKRDIDYTFLCKLISATGVRQESQGKGKEEATTEITKITESNIVSALSRQSAATRVNRWALRAAVTALVSYLVLLKCVHRWADPADVVPLSGVERCAALFAAVLQLGAGVARLFFGAMRRCCGERATATPALGLDGWGGVVAIVVLFGVAGYSNLQLALGKTVVKVDSMTGNRESMVRWCEYVSLGTLMAFLTDALDAVDWKAPCAVGAKVGVSLLCGFALPFIPEGYPGTWGCVLAAGLVSFYVGVLPPCVRKHMPGRHHKNPQDQDIDDNKDGGNDGMAFKTFNGSAMFFEFRLRRAAQRLSAVTTVLWTFIILLWVIKWVGLGSYGKWAFRQVWCRGFSTTECHDSSSTNGNEAEFWAALPFIVDCGCDIVLKFFYATILIEQYEACFDRAAKELVVEEEEGGGGGGGGGGDRRRHHEKWQ